MDAVDTEELRTIWCGNLSEKVTEELLYELFLQAGPLEKVVIPKDRDGKPFSFSFITFKHQCSVNYTVQLMQGVKLFDRDIRLKPKCNQATVPANNPYDRDFSYNNSQRNYRSDQMDHYRRESLQGRWLNSGNRERDLKPNYHKREYKRHRH